MRDEAMPGGIDKSGEDCCCCLELLLVLESTIEIEEEGFTSFLLLLSGFSLLLPFDRVEPL